MTEIINPHDKLFREIWSNIKEARSFLSNYLPSMVLDIIDLNTLEISKDSFVEKDLKEYFSDILYQIDLAGETGYIYLLFEHKSSEEKWIHLQLLRYLLSIWQLDLKKGRKGSLPVIVPLVLYHGSRKWKSSTRFSSLFHGPEKVLAEYIPDFEYVLIDLSRYSDEEIKGTLIVRAAMLLFKHVFDRDLRDKLPGILSLMQDLLAQDTGLKYLETLLRYLFNTVEDIEVEEIKDMVEKSISEDKGGIIMTLAERLRDEGYRRGIEEGKEQWLQQGIHEGIEIAIKLKFEDESDQEKVMALIRQIKDVDRLKALEHAIKEAKTASELIERINA